MGRDRGSYTLVLLLRKGARLPVGKLGTFFFPAGYYLYLGSGQGGLRARVRRHLRSAKALHWHIDYLTQVAEPLEVWYRFSTPREECRWRQAAQKLPQTRLWARGFGASDCRCPSHLVYSPVKPSFEVFQKTVGPPPEIPLTSPKPQPSPPRPR